MKYFFLILTLFLASCAGYRFQTQANPFAQYGIKKLYVVHFYNHGNIAKLSAILTKKTMLTLLRYKGLQIVNDPKIADAYLLGLVNTPSKIVQSRVTQALRSASFLNLGDQREEVFVPGTQTINSKVNFVLIKTLTPLEKKLMQSGPEKYSFQEKIIFNHTILANTSFNREYFADSLEVVSTQSRGSMEFSLENMAAQVLRDFENQVLLAF